MLLNYNKAEQKQLNDIDLNLKGVLDKAYEELNKAETEFEKLDTQAQQGKRKLTDTEAKVIAELERTQTEYGTLLTEYEEKRGAVTRKAETREARYFTKNTSELAERLAREFETQIASFGILQSHADFHAIYQNDEKIKERLIMSYRQYLDILQKHDENNYQNILNFIDNAIANKEEITLAYKTRIEENPIDSNQTKSIWDKPYLLLSQNNATNDFNKVARLNSSRGTLSLWDKQATYQQGNLTIFIPHYEQLLQNATIGKNGEINTPTKKVLDIATIIFTNNGHDSSIRFSLEDYTKLCGLCDKKEARKQVNTALEVLFNMSISYDDSKNKTKSRNYRDMRLVDDKGIKNGIVYLHFAYAFSEMLADCPVMPYPVALFQASKGTQHRNAYYIARKVLEHVNMNGGKKNERRIAVKTLLESAPFLATEEEVRNGDRRLRDRIITPFLYDLEEACVYLGLTSEGYELYYAGGKAIPDNKLTELDYETFISAYIWFDTLPDYPKRKTPRNQKKSKGKKKK